MSRRGRNHAEPKADAAHRALATIVHCGAASFVILQLIDFTAGLRVRSEDEDIGLDLALHDEQGYKL
jgi:Amt family ammonium transporter